MWLYLPGGFVSIVNHRVRAGYKLVRSRRRAHLESFLSIAGANPGCESLEQIYEDAHADYPWRVDVPAEELKKILGAHVDAMVYDNFKAAIRVAPRDPFARVCHDAYEATWGLDERKTARNPRNYEN